MEIGTFVKYRGFTGSINYDFDDKIHYGKILDIPDKIAYHANSVIELWERFQNNVDHYINLCEEMGKPVPVEAYLQTNTGIYKKIAEAKNTEWVREGFSDQEVEEIVREAKSSIKETNAKLQ